MPTNAYRTVLAGTAIAIVSGFVAASATSRIDAARTRTAIVQAMAEVRAAPKAAAARAPSALLDRLRRPTPAYDAQRMVGIEDALASERKAERDLHGPGGVDDRLVNLEHDRKTVDDRMTELEVQLNRAVHLIADAVDPNGGTTAAATSGRDAIAEQADERTLRDASGSKSPTVMEKAIGEPPWAKAR